MAKVTRDPLSRFLNQRTSALERRANLRPMNFGEIMDFSFKVYQALGMMILRLTAIPAVFTFAGVAFLFEIVLPRFGVTSNASNMNVQVGEAVGVILLALVVAGPIALVGISLATGVVVKLTSDYIHGNVPDPKAATRAGIQSLRQLFWLHIFELLAGWSGILVALGLLILSAFVGQSGDTVSSGLVAMFSVLAWIVGPLILILVSSRHSLSPAITMFEGLKPFAAAKRSAQLLRSNGFQPSGYGAIFTVGLLIPFLVVLLLPGFELGKSLIDLDSFLEGLTSIPLLGLMLGKVLQFFPLYLAVWVLVPVWCTTSTILYFERRIRLEGYDIEALAKDVYRHQKHARFEL
jgi:hypothetical protein